MNARNQLLVVLTALMLVTTGWAMVATVGASSGTSGDEDDVGVNDSGDAEEPVPEETANESVSETAEVTANETAEVTANETANETTDDVTTDDAAEPVEDEQAAQVTFEDQATDGQTVVVDSVTVDEGGFVAIHNSSLLVGNTVGSVIGASEYLEPGTHENVTVTLDEPLTADETLIAMPHLDTNGNQTYDFVTSEGQEDGPYLTPEGEPVTDDAVVTLDADTGADAEVGNESEQAVDENESEDAVAVEENETGVDDTIEENETIAEEDGEEPETDEADVASEEADGAPESIDVTIEQAQIFVIVVDGEDLVETDTEDGADTDDIEENETDTDDIEENVTDTDDADTNGQEDETDTEATVIESEDDGEDEAEETDGNGNGTGTVIEENESAGSLLG